MDATGAVYQQIHSKVSSAKMLPGKLKQTLASTLASSVSPKLVAKKLAEKIPKTLMYKLSEKGLQVQAETVFIESTFVVIQIAIHHVDTVLLTKDLSDPEADDDESVESAVLDAWMDQQQDQTTKKEPYNVTNRLDTISRGGALARQQASIVSVILQYLWSLVSPLFRHTVESQYLPTLIQNTIRQKMDQLLALKLKDKLIEARTQVLNEDKQARFFFGELKRLRTLDSTSKKNE